jgi:hypothetical protein
MATDFEEKAVVENGYEHGVLYDIPDPDAGLSDEERANIVCEQL